MLFSMVERGMDAEVVGDKGKTRAKPADGTNKVGEEATWAVVVTKELWRKGVW
jgi:protein SDA1